MPSKTDRILSYLPGTFRALPKPTALFTVVNAFGGELQGAENSLAAVMLAHWVDHADRGAEVIADLARIAALYGLAPRDDEDVEAFREHLKRYVRTFLEGTATVQGILRVAAETLGLRIGDLYPGDPRAGVALNPWWTRPDDALITAARRADDAATLVFGFEAGWAAGKAAQPGRATGRVNLAEGVNLGSARTLRIKVDTAAAVDVILPASGALRDVVMAINSALGAEVASDDGHFLTLSAARVGPNSRLEVQRTDGDAAPALLGLSPRDACGTDALPARAIGSATLGETVDLTAARYLRLVLDGRRRVEVDCAAGAGNLAAVPVAHVVQAINAALEANVASWEVGRLVLTSPTVGSASRLGFEPAPAQDAMLRLFGPIPTFYVGQDARAAQIVGTVDMSGGIDLSKQSRLRIRVDARRAVTVDCAGALAGHTRPDEVAAAINDVIGRTVASHDGRYLRLTSITTGDSSTIALEPLPSDEDAAELIFGLGPRTFLGTPAEPAYLAGAVDLSAGVDLRARHLIHVAVDDRPPVLVNLTASGEPAGAATPTDLVAAINAQVGATVASTDGSHLILTSPTAGSGGSVAVLPLEETRRRRFVTQATVTDEAAQMIFGFVTREAQGAAGESARIIGKADLSRGTDLRQQRFLRFRVDSGPALELDFAACLPRPRLAMLDEIADAIEQAAHPDPDPVQRRFATHDGHYLILEAAERISLELPQMGDAADLLFGGRPEPARGSAAIGVRFRGLADLGEGINLPADAALALRVDDFGPVEIRLTGPQGERKSPGQIATAINLALAQAGRSGDGVARPEGGAIILTSPSKGATSRIELATPAGADATMLVFGVTAPRVYIGADAAAATLVGTRELSAGVDLRVARFLRLRIDGQPAVNVDCAQGLADPAAVSLDQVIAAINRQTGVPVASKVGPYLGLISPTAGSASQLSVLPYNGGDARPKLFETQSAAVDSVPSQREIELPAQTVQGAPPTAAIITGEVDLLAPVDLSERRVLRLSVDDGPPVEVDAAGSAAEATTLDEIISRINAIVLGLASATEDSRLRLTSPTVGERSALSLLPVRALELIEYPPAPVELAWPAVRHADCWIADNDGAADADLEIWLQAPHGAAGPAFVNLTGGERIRLALALCPGETVHLWPEPRSGLAAEVIAADGTRRPVPGSRILAGPLAAQAWTPFTAEHPLRANVDGEGMLALNNPEATAVTVLRGRTGCAALTARAAEAHLPAILDQPDWLAGRLRQDPAGWWLADAAGVPVARVLPGQLADLATYSNRVVALLGVQHAGNGATPSLIATRIAVLFDVTLSGREPGGETLAETYPAATIGLGAETVGDLTRRIMVEPSRLVIAEDANKAALLRLPRGRSEWRYLECDAPRFGRARFDTVFFPGLPCAERGVFDVSRFGARPVNPRAALSAPPDLEAAVYAPAAAGDDPPVSVRFGWQRRRPGAFILNLPADLPPRFGGRFNEARFALAGAGADLAPAVATEPRAGLAPAVATEPRAGLIAEIVAHTQLVKAEVVQRVPIGFEAFPIPFRRPRIRMLTGGAEDQEAQLFLVEEEVPGYVRLVAARTGAWGNDIAVSVRPAGPGRFDIEISYRGARFECARRIVLAGRASATSQPLLPALAAALLKPGPVGIAHARAAGVQVAVTRDRTWPDDATGV